MSFLKTHLKANLFLLTFLILGLAAFIYSSYSNKNTQNNFNILSQINQLKLIDKDIDNFIYQRLTVTNYDTIAGKNHSFNRILRRLKADENLSLSLLGKKEILERLNLVDQEYQIKESYLEKYKSYNSIVNNSLRYIIDLHDSIYHSLKKDTQDPKRSLQNLVLGRLLNGIINLAGRFNDANIRLRSLRAELLESEKKYNDSLRDNIKSFGQHTTVIIEYRSKMRKIVSQNALKRVSQALMSLELSLIDFFETKKKEQKNIANTLFLALLLSFIMVFVLYIQLEKRNKTLIDVNTAHERFVPKEFISHLDKHSIVDVQLGDQVQKKMSVLFSDIRSFTTLSEKMTPEETFKFINSYLRQMEPVVKEHNGFIDKYIGDSIMALFDESADDALQAAISMQHTLVDYNNMRRQAGYQPIQIGIGINTGHLMLGIIGGPSRMEGTVISDAVNLASRVEGMTRVYKTSLLISEETYSSLKDPSRYSIRMIDRVKAKGKSKAVFIYEVFDTDIPKVREKKLATQGDFEKAVGLYLKDELEDACHYFQKCLSENPEDQIAQIYAGHCNLELDKKR